MGAMSVAYDTCAMQEGIAVPKVLSEGLKLVHGSRSNPDADSHELIWKGCSLEDVSLTELKMLLLPRWKLICRCLGTVDLEASLGVSPAGVRRRLIKIPSSRFSSACIESILPRSHYCFVYTM